MNEFDGLLNLSRIDIIDLKIYMKIDSELNKLEDISKLKQYKEQIHSRRIGVKFFFKNFEYNNCILKSKNRFGFNSTLFYNSDIYENDLDNIILNKIEYVLNKMYYEISHNNINDDNKFVQEELDKILDRKLGVQTLFENYSGNMDFLMKYKGISQNTSQTY